MTSTTDTTPRNRAENELQRAERLAAIKIDRARFLDEAIVSAERALKMIRFEDAPKLYLRAMNVLGYSVRDRPNGRRSANHDRAIGIFERALASGDPCSEPVQHAAILKNLAQAYLDRQHGRRSEDLEKALRCFWQALDLERRHASPKDQATTFRGLGAAYERRLRGERRINLARAVDFYRRVLAWPPDYISVLDRAEAWRGLGMVYLERDTGGGWAANRERACSACRQALALVDRENHPEEWASMVTSLGLTWAERLRGDRQENQEKALAHYNQALEHIDRRESPVDWASLRFNMGSLLQHRLAGRRTANLRAASVAFRDTLEIFTREDFPIDWAETTTNLGVIFQSRTDGAPVHRRAEAAAAFNAALQVLDPSETPVSWARARMNLSNLWIQADYRPAQGQTRASLFDEAIEALEEVLRVIDRDVEPDLWGAAMMNLGVAHAERPAGSRGVNLERAVEAYHGALEVQTLDTAPADRGLTLINLAVAYAERFEGDREHNLSSALARLEEARQAAPVNMQPDDRAFLLRTLGNTYADLFSDEREHYFERSVACLEEALDLLPRAAAPLGWAEIQTDLGIVLSHHRFPGDPIQNLEKAITCYREALEVLDPQDAPDLWSRTMSNLANALAERTHGDQAENLEEAVATYRKALDRQHPESDRATWARTWVNLGLTLKKRVYGDLEQNFDEAIECFEKALASIDRDERPEEWTEASSRLADAWAEHPGGEAAENLEQAITIYQQIRNGLSRRSRPWEWAAATSNLGLTLVERLRGDRAQSVRDGLELMYEALEIMTRERSPVEWAELQNNVGIGHARREGEELDALRAFRRALEVFTPELFPDRCRSVSRNLADFLRRRRRWRGAAAAYAQAIRVNELLYRASILPNSRLAELTVEPGLYTAAALVLARAGALGQAVATMEQGRARVLGEMLERESAELVQVRDIAPELFKHYRETVDRLRDFEADERIYDSLAGEEREEEVDFDVLRDQAREIRRRLDDVVERIRDLPGLEKFLADADLDDIVRAARPGRPLVFAGVTEDGSLALLVDRPVAGSPVEIIPIIAPDLDIYAFAELLAGTEEQPGYLSAQWLDEAAFRRALTHVLEQLGRRLARPVIAQLRRREVSSVTWIAGSGLDLLPVAAAPYDENARPGCWLEDFDVLRAPSVRFLRAAQAAASRSVALTPRLLGIADPQPHPQPLRFARVELETVTQYFSPSNHTVLRGNQATPAALIEELAGVTHLHFACHGHFNPKKPFYSHLELAQEEVLTLRQILESGAFRNVRLVVLSACQTGLAEIERLPDEALGLAAGFLQAGVAGVVASLWPVDGLATAILMERFYRLHLVGDPAIGERPLPPASALRRAQLWLRDVTTGELIDTLDREENSLTAQIITRLATSRRDSRPFAAAHNWAAFVFFGA